MGKYSWDNLANKIQKDAFKSENKGGYEEDSRFYKLSRNKNNVGGSLIRFLPSKDGIPFVKVIKINAEKGANNRFCKEYSPLSIGKPDPFNEMFSKLWKEGKKEEAKKLGRKIRFITQIKVLKDPQNPENNGKFFLFDMSQSLFKKIEDALEPSEDEMALDEDLKPIEVFDPVNGHDFLLKIKMGSNDILTYEDSKFADKPSKAYKSDAEFEKDVKNGYELGEFLEESFYKSYDELKECLDWFLGIEGQTETTPEPEATPEPEKTPESDEDDEDLDELLDDLEN